MSNNSKSKSLFIRLSEEEYEILKKRADNNEMPLASYAREKIFFDAPNLEKGSAEFKILKAVSYCAGVLGKMSEVQFSSNQDQKSLEETIKEVMASNGINSND
jgi:predicted DNA-binding protein